MLKIPSLGKTMEKNIRISLTRSIWNVVESDLVIEQMRDLVKWIGQSLMSLRCKQPLTAAFCQPGTTIFFFPVHTFINCNSYLLNTILIYAADPRYSAMEILNRECHRWLKAATTLWYKSTRYRLASWVYSYSLRSLAEWEQQLILRLTCIELGVRITGLIKFIISVVNDGLTSVSLFLKLPLIIQTRSFASVPMPGSCDWVNEGCSF